MSNKVNILGSEISLYNLGETVEKIRELALDGGHHYVCVSNVHTVVMGLHDASFRRVTNEATLATADGVPLIWASKVVGGPKIHGRASGPDIIPLLLNDAQQPKLRHFFYGGSNETLSILRPRLKELAPNAEIVGYYSPPIRKAGVPEEELSSQEINECTMIDEFKPHIVWVGLGAPKQEIWMHRARKHLKAPVLVGVGAAFDFLAGLKPRAPEWMQKSGLEWFHRLMSEPNRLTGRYLKTNPVFVAAVAKQALFNRNKTKAGIK